LREGWPGEIGWSLVLAGIAAITHYSLIEKTYLQSIDLQENVLAQWFAMRSGGDNPYFLALALKGLQRYNKHTAHEIERNTLSLSDTLHLLKSARPSAITAYSIQLLEETTQEIEKLLKEEDGR